MTHKEHIEEHIKNYFSIDFLLEFEHYERLDILWDKYHELVGMLDICYDTQDITSDEFYHLLRYIVELRNELSKWIRTRIE